MRFRDRTPAFLVACGLFVLSAATHLSAQDSATIHFTSDSVFVALGQQPLRFHAGDDVRWADPDFDDGSWHLLSPASPADSMAALGWEGMGWFRFRLAVDSLLARESLVLVVSQRGAFEIYQNGRLLHRVGRPSADPELERHINTDRIEITVPLNGRVEHQIAIRFSNHPLRNSLVASVGGLGIGFWLVQSDHYYTNRRPDYQVNVVVWALGLGVFGLMFFLHLVLYLLAPEFKENLAFALYTGLTAVLLVGIQVIWNHPGATSALSIPIIRSSLSVITISMIPLLAAAYFVFYGRLLRLIWLFGVVLLAVGIYMVAEDTFEIASAAMLLAALEMLRVAGLAVFRKQEGGWIMLGGILLLMIGIGMDFYFDTWLNRVSDLLIIFAVPTSMSMLIGFRFARQREEIARHADDLDVQVADRTAELEQSLDDLKKTQAQLVQSEKMASLGSLTAGIAHEIKNPLNFINNFAEVNEELARELEEEIAKGSDVSDILTDLKRNASVIAEHGKRADGIVRSMMQHARGGTGEREQVDINKFVAEYVALAYHGKRAQKPDFNSEIAEQYDDTVGRISIVPQDIGRVLVNLIGNAFDAVEGTAEPKVGVSTHRSDGRVEIRVEDNGPGVPEGIREKIFEPFFTTKPTGLGTGIGLSVSYDIVTQGHGGSLRVDESTAGGAVFVVTLPYN